MFEEKHAEDKMPADPAAIILEKDSNSSSQTFQL
jgi:hypothetical protein